jgi:hydrogenase expression/formation protein HypE
MDHLYVANEGILVAVAGGDVAQYVLDTMKTHPLGKNASIIGEASKGPAGRVLMRTAAGGTRVVEMLEGEQLPRIC